MQLDRNTNSSGYGKYALLNLRTDKIEWGRLGEVDEFFVLKLRDIHSLVALEAYANSLRLSGQTEFSEEISRLCDRAGKNSEFCKEPD